MLLSHPSTEAGPSRLPLVATAPSPRGERRHLKTRPIVLSSDLIIDDDPETSYIGSADVASELISEPAPLFGARVALSAASDRLIPNSLRPMASEMVRPPEVVG